MMNVHHLELFYYVATFGGISRAVRHIPYGIQQPAVSSQILLLEEDLGTKLFERNPFRLTREGEELFAHIRPFFDNLDAVAAKVRRRAAPLIRIGASELVLREYLPAVVASLSRKPAKVRLSLQSGFTPQLESWLRDGEIDLAITPLDGRPAARLRCLRLMRVPLVLLVPRGSPYREASDLWKGGVPAEPLITLPAVETISRLFKKGLHRLKVEWPAAVEASSLDLIPQYVADDYGAGLTIDMPGATRHARVRRLALGGFEPLEVAALWAGRLSPLVRAVIEEGQRYVRRTWPQWQCEEQLEPAAAAPEA